MEGAAIGAGVQMVAKGSRSFKTGQKARSGEKREMNERKERKAEATAKSRSLPLPSGCTPLTGLFRALAMRVGTQEVLRSARRSRLSHLTSSNPNLARTTSMDAQCW